MPDRGRLGRPAHSRRVDGGQVLAARSTVQAEPVIGVRTMTRAAAPLITACADGPLLVRGDIEIVDATGSPIPCSRRTVALCRCGVSTIKPFCDGTHKIVGFKTEPLESEPLTET